MNQADDRFLASQVAKFRQQHPELFHRPDPEHTGQERMASPIVNQPEQEKTVTNQMG